ncbi:hypothetical protein PHET_07322 [Paragonimus heterotremus]|uniref:Uncharacterized protein n=1 Tax=Paragonimus heterotremus TaxID=100268 RepID=A0A8J4WEC8_9TREM|nr:hypothetical protein PHET_07322 [Paragonimus heterotremus]
MWVIGRGDPCRVAVGDTVVAHDERYIGESNATYSAKLPSFNFSILFKILQGDCEDDNLNAVGGLNKEDGNSNYFWTVLVDGGNSTRVFTFDAHCSCGQIKKNKHMRVFEIALSDISRRTTTNSLPLIALTIIFSQHFTELKLITSLNLIRLRLSSGLAMNVRLVAYRA